jgi:putative transposase
VDTVGKNKKAIEEYIRKQLQEDIATDQISIKEYVDPFEKDPIWKLIKILYHKKERY